MYFFKKSDFSIETPYFLCQNRIKRENAHNLAFVSSKKDPGALFLYAFLR